MKRLIVNADDYGRTPGVNEGTLEAYVKGIVTSATVMILEPAAQEGIRLARAVAPDLALGLHFAPTGGGPCASPPGSIPHLTLDGHFVRSVEDLPDRIPAAEVRRGARGADRSLRAGSEEDPRRTWIPTTTRRCTSPSSRSSRRWP